jgi:hypothetical protein
MCGLYIYKGVKITIGSQDMEVELIPLKLHDFDLIFRMN